MVGIGFGAALFLVLVIAVIFCSMKVNRTRDTSTQGIIKLLKCSNMFV